jgi:large subunit ribosomal protein L10
MTKEQKYAQVAELTEQLRSNPNFYILDIMGMTVADNNRLRRKFHEHGFKLSMVKNTLIKKALENLEGDHSEIYPALKTSSTLIFVKEAGKEPAVVLKEFRGDAEMPRLKGAYIDGSAYLGDDQLEALSNLKSKEDLIGEVISLLQSPAKNVISALKGQGGKIAGILKTLEERGQ